MLEHVAGNALSVEFLSFCYYTTRHENYSKMCLNAIELAVHM